MRQLSLVERAQLQIQLRKTGFDQLADKLNEGYVWIAESDGENALLIDSSSDVTADQIHGDFEMSAAEMLYDKEASLQLRRELIKIRDRALQINRFDDVVVLSHVIAWMFRMMEAVTV